MCSLPAPPCTRDRYEEMSIESTEAVMKRFVEFINTADEQLARQVIASEAVFYAPTHPEPLRGPDDYLGLFAIMRNGFPDIQWTLEETITEGNRVAARFTMRGTHQATSSESRRPARRSRSRLSTSTT